MTHLSLTAQAVSSLVEVSEDQPVTTSLIIAQVLERPHYGVIQLVRQHEESLNEFGLVKFEIAPRKSDTLNDTFEMCRGAIKPLAVAILNEQQATLLISFMSNTPKVVDFKIRLVKAFYEMRQRLEEEKLKEARLPKFACMQDAFDYIVQNRPELHEEITTAMAFKAQRDGMDYEHVAHAMYVLKRAYDDIDNMYKQMAEMDKCLKQAREAMVQLNALKTSVFDMVDVARQELGQYAGNHHVVEELYQLELKM
jgi:phage regulator Rha-like protein